MHATTMIDGVKYTRSINYTHVIYSALQTVNAIRDALVDIGDDIPLIFKTNRFADVDPQDKILAHLTKQKAFKPGDIKRLMSDSQALVPAKPPPKPTPQQAIQHKTIVIDGVKYSRSVNYTNVIYSVQQTVNAIRDALVDRDANGAILGDNIRLIFKTNCFVHGLPYLKMRPPTNCELSNPCSHWMWIGIQVSWIPSLKTWRNGHNPFQRRNLMRSGDLLTVLVFLRIII